jgi:hypothetical protein
VKKCDQAVFEVGHAMVSLFTRNLGSEIKTLIANVLIFVAKNETKQG